MASLPTGRDAAAKVHSRKEGIKLEGVEIYRSMSSALCTNDAAILGYQWL